MSIEATSASALPDPDADTSMLRVLKRILRSGSFGDEEVTTLAAIAHDHNIDEADRSFAHRSLRWLAEQSAMVTTQIWQPDYSVRH